MSTADPDVDLPVTYGNLRRPARPGLWGLPALATVAMLASLVALVVVALNAGAGAADVVIGRGARSLRRVRSIDEPSSRRLVLAFGCAEFPKYRQAPFRQIRNRSDR